MSVALQQEREYLATENLLNSLGMGALFRRFGEPNKKEPDTLYTIKGRAVGIEVTESYYSQEDATAKYRLEKGLLRRREREAKYGKPFPPNTSQFTLRKKTERAIAATIERKANNRYRGAKEYWLCIDVRLDRFNREDIDNCLSNLTIPRNPFTRIYLVWEGPSGTQSHLLWQRQGIWSTLWQRLER